MDPISISVRCKAEKQKNFAGKAQTETSATFYCSTVKKEETTEIISWIQNLN